MRVAMLSVHSSPLARLGSKEAGGMNVYVRELARELGQRGILVDIFTRSQERDAPTIVPLSRGVRLINLHAGPVAPYDKYQLLTYLPEFVSRVRCFADGEDVSYDLIHSHYWLSGKVALALRRVWQAPVVHMFHTLGAMKNRVARSAEEVETSHRIAIERRLLHEVDAVVAATPLDRAQMVWHYGADPGRIRVIPCGVDLQRFQPRDRNAARTALGIADDAIVLVCVGRMEPLKGMDALIRATARLIDHHPEWRDRLQVVLVGGEDETQTAQWNSEQRRLDQLRQSLGVRSQVRFVGTQPQERLPLYYVAADVVAAPSHYESFGLAALEALACGAVVVASNVGGLALTIEDRRSGLLFPPDNDAALAAHIERVLTDEDLAARLRSAAVQRAAEYSWPTIARRIITLYEDVKTANAAFWSARRLVRVS